jgi:hypothetical protein
MVMKLLESVFHISFDGRAALAWISRVARITSIDLPGAQRKSDGRSF